MNSNRIKRFQGPCFGQMLSVLDKMKIHPKGKYEILRNRYGKLITCPWNFFFQHSNNTLQFSTKVLNHHKKQQNVIIMR